MQYCLMQYCHLPDYKKFIKGFKKNPYNFQISNYNVIIIIIIVPQVKNTIVSFNTFLNTRKLKNYIIEDYLNTHCLNNFEQS